MIRTNISFWLLFSQPTELRMHWFLLIVPLTTTTTSFPNQLNCFKMAADHPREGPRWTLCLTSGPKENIFRSVFYVLLVCVQIHFVHYIRPLKTPHGAAPREKPFPTTRMFSAGERDYITTLANPGQRLTGRMCVCPWPTPFSADLLKRPAIGCAKLSILYSAIKCYTKHILGPGPPPRSELGSLGKRENGRCSHFVSFV